jgi:F0F1-type ATP synthase membrane subunit c/vacuolar-type H+-ATPase subunit K
MPTAPDPTSTGGASVSAGGASVSIGGSSVGASVAAGAQAARIIAAITRTARIEKSFLCMFLLLLRELDLINMGYWLRLLHQEKENGQ